MGKDTVKESGKIETNYIAGHGLWVKLKATARCFLTMGTSMKDSSRMSKNLETVV